MNKRIRGNFHCPPCPFTLFSCESTCGWERARILETLFFTDSSKGWIRSPTSFLTRPSLSCKGRSWLVIMLPSSLAVDERAADKSAYDWWIWGICDWIWEVELCKVVCNESVNEATDFWSLTNSASILSERLATREWAEAREDEVAAVIDCAVSEAFCLG